MSGRSGGLRLPVHAALWMLMAAALLLIAFGVSFGAH